VLDTFNTPALHWNIPDKDRKMKAVVDDDTSELRTEGFQDEFLPTSNKLYQRVYNFKGNRGLHSPETSKLLEENCLKTFYLFLYYVKHGKKVPTASYGEKAAFWTSLMTDGRLQLAAKVRMGDFEALLKKTEILLYSEFAAVCKALAVLNAPEAIILLCEKFVAAREDEVGQEADETTAIEAVNALRRRLQGDRPPSGGKEEEPEGRRRARRRAARAVIRTTVVQPSTSVTKRISQSRRSSTS
jgi:hypothetical protein